VRVKVRWRSCLPSGADQPDPDVTYGRACSPVDSDTALDAAVRRRLLLAACSSDERCARRQVWCRYQSQAMMAVGVLWNGAAQSPRKIDRQQACMHLHLQLHLHLHLSLAAPARCAVEMARQTVNVSVPEARVRGELL
jgi:hypothetical protein